MKKATKMIIVIIVAVLLLAIIAIAWQNYQKPSTPQDYRVGVIVPLSGDLAYFGTDFVDGLNLVFDETTSTREAIELIVDDSKFNTTEAVSAYQKMMAVNNPDILISFGNGADEALLPLIDRDQLPTIFTFSSASQIPEKSQWAFRYFTNADIDAPVMAKYAVEELDLKSFGVLYIQDGFGIGYNEVFGKSVKELGGKVVSSEPIQYTEFSYKTQLGKIIASNPDAIYLVAQDYQELIALKEIREYGYQGKVLAVGTIATKQAIEKAGGDAEGVYLTAFCTDGTPEDYKQKFREKYGKEPGFMSELGYDIATFIIDSAKTKIDADNSTIKNSLRNNLLNLKDYKTNSGIVSADANGEIAIPVCPKVVNEGKIFNLVTQKYSNY